MSPIRPAAFLAMLPLVLGALTCSSAPSEIPACRGELRTTVDSGVTGYLPTREAAAARALEATFQIDVRDVVLEHVDGHRYLATTIDGLTSDDPPSVVLEDTVRGGFVPAGVVC